MKPLRVLGVVALFLSACGARTGLRVPDGALLDAPDASDSPDVSDSSDVFDASDSSDVFDAPDVSDIPDVFDAPDVLDASDVPDVLDASDVPDVVDVRDASDAPDVCVPVADGCGAVERCGDGADNNCNGIVDEGCACEPGAVQPCFAGPPGRRGVGACADGAQLCAMTGRWGACVGGIAPRPDVCNGLDNLCDGCSQQNDCPITCPAPGDPRVTDGRPFADYALRGRDFYPGPARAWRWTVEGGPCDRLSTTPSFTVRDANAEIATFTPLLSGDYRVTLTVVTGMGRTLTCTWLVHVEGPGLRVEMCYPENTTVDLDLFLSRPGFAGSWYPMGRDVFSPSPSVCGWHNCEATIRGANSDGGMVPRADWGYRASPLTACASGPHGPEWTALGSCANPRLDIDNNLSKAIGSPENINVDAPRDGEVFRVMVHNFSGTVARPLVNIYCSGRRVATYGEAPDTVPAFTGDTNPLVGAMWRVVDVRTRVDASGRTTCEVTPLHPTGATRGYDVTYNNARF